MRSYGKVKVCIRKRKVGPIVLAIKKWRLYLLGRHFIVPTDQQSLKFLLENGDRRVSKLSGYDNTVREEKIQLNKFICFKNKKPRKEQIFTMSANLPTNSARRSSILMTMCLFTFTVLNNSCFFMCIHLMGSWFIYKGPNTEKKKSYKKETGRMSPKVYFICIKPHKLFYLKY